MDRQESYPVFQLQEIHKPSWGKIHGWEEMSQ